MGDAVGDVSDRIENIVGFRLEDIGKIDPFKDTLSIVWFVIFIAFIGTVAALISIAFLYSLCDCLCSCCCGRSRRVQDGDKARDRGHDNLAMDDIGRHGGTK